ITVDPAGQTKVETKGFTGGGCREASRFVEQALGQRTAETMTAEFYEGPGGPPGPPSIELSGPGPLPLALTLPPPPADTTSLAPSIPTANHQRGDRHDARRAPLGARPRRVLGPLGPVVRARRRPRRGRRAVPPQRLGAGHLGRRPRAGRRR